MTERRGTRKNPFKVGEKVKVAGSPLPAEVVDVILPDKPRAHIRYAVKSTTEFGTEFIDVYAGMMLEAGE